ncbi:epoxide hydrolase family protein [Amycolatopsis azurea]|uniref:Epoxide hydrolase n=1 Tax=Amycolatopsis azurea DSM 43854 TaxID=1238180 RepID=M2Q209_9PSEU|nr:epoxide hydrolase family protein [Amycolatopsis azurea]EMD25975.1 Epoxide hydrolase [Amycolatopsis azurea DSM 43854]OOC01807.1 epoxide hydrolase [Amycolatopsis azurea DSM 43854]
METTPFRAGVPEADLEDLRARLRRTRWPEGETVDDWSQGVPAAYLRELCSYWAESYDWRAAESRLNAIPQFRSEIDGLGIHYLHARSPHPGALPLILSHGWPGSIFEFLDVIGPLTDPVAHGGDAADAFHVVVPSLPGYGFSDKPEKTGWSIQRIADAWIHLMDGLGYERFGAQGGDWGTNITTLMGRTAPERLVGIHLNPPLAAPDPATFGDLTEAERKSLDDLERGNADGSGYANLQRTRPQTIGYALSDSPAALCAWIVEKFQAWTDCDGRPENALSRDAMLDDVTLYWLTGTGASSARLYWESFAEVSSWFTESTVDTIGVPAGCSIFPRESPRPSRRWAERRFTDIRYWNELERGGHFAAFEQPAVFTEEVRSFFRLVR